MTEKRFTIKPQDDLFGVVDNYSADKVCVINGIRTEIEAKWLCKDMNTLNDENEQLKKELNKLKKFEYGGEHIRLSINIETGELQRHIYATGQWFGDFDRVLVDNWLSKEDYQRFINRVIEVYNTEFKKELRE